MIYRYSYITNGELEGDLRAVLAENMGYHMREQGISTAKLARMTGIARTTLTSIEQGASDARLSHLQRVADALCIEPAQLLANPTANGHLPR